MEKLLLNESELSDALGVSVRTIQRWRESGDGPKFVKLSSGQKATVRYRVRDIKEWVDGLGAQDAEDKQQSA